MYFCNLPYNLSRAVQWEFRVGGSSPGLILVMFNLDKMNLELCLVIQMCLAFGIAGLLWPEKFRPLFDVLLFPWAASYRAVRINSIAAIGLSLLLLVRLVIALA
jgi:hypothetical protein